MTQAEARYDFFNDNCGYSKMLNTYHDREFSEFTVERWGDVSQYRVYGNTEENFYITER